MNRFVSLRFPCLRLQLLEAARPELRDSAWAMGLRQEGFHAKVQDASPEALRMGIERGMHLSELRRRFPRVPVIPPDFQLLSRFRRVLSTLCDARCSAWSVDDDGSAILDLGGVAHLVGTDLEAWGAQFRADIARTTGVRAVNIAVAGNRATAEILAQVRFDLPLSAPRDAELESILGGVSLDAVPWLGRNIRDQMERYGIRTLSDVRRFPHAFLNQHFGEPGERLSALSHGLDTDASGGITPTMAEEYAFRGGDSDYAALRERIHELADRLSFALRERRLAAREVRLRLSWSDGRELSSVLRAGRPCRSFLELRDVAWALLSELSVRRGPLHALRLSVSRTEALDEQQDLFRVLDRGLPAVVGAGRVFAQEAILMPV